MTNPNIRDAWPRVLPFALLILLLAGDSLPIWPVQLQPWRYGLRTLAVLLVLFAVWPRLEELRGFRDVPGRWWVLAILVGVGVFVLWVWIGPLVRVGAIPAVSLPPWPQEPVQAQAWIALRLLGAVLLVPVVEEVFWRSYLMRRLDRAEFLGLSPERASQFAVIASSAVFALAHREILAAFVTGVIYATLYQRSRRLWVPILAHAVTNLSLGLFVLYTERFEFW